MSYYPGYNPYSLPMGQPIAYPNQYLQRGSYAPVQYSSPLTQSVVPRMAVQPVMQQSYIAQPAVVQQVMSQPVQQTIRGESRIQYKEFQRQVVEMETETVQVQVPKTKYVTDYYPIEYQTEYIPRTVYEQQTEYIPITKSVPRVEYEAVEREIQRPQQVEIQQSFVQQYIPQPTQYIQQQVYQSYVQQPAIQSFNQQPLQYSRVRSAQSYIPSYNYSNINPYPVNYGGFRPY
ncbi:unnamed protein product [Paramecium pentaurelia]|uniref:Uncharacterized protein n=1 Tax=Paramecium pentaurelia TaxID=43138 RepID=A0A8S1W2N1_9CILI|nr:unnamed protein product [Paramecium pentaurelia]